MANVAVDIQYNMPCHSDPARVPCDEESQGIYII